MTGGPGSNIVALAALTGLLALLPLLAVTVTSFAKVAVVMFLVRNAVGIQQTPPNIVLYSIALIISGFVMAPVLTDVYNVINDQRSAFDSVAAIETVATEAARPLRKFLAEHASADARAFFVDASRQMWAAESAKEQVGPNDLAMLVPSFLVSELKRAFEIGILLYLPFVMVDLVVSAILLALGMQMMSPTIVSTPFKLMLFVWVDGWSKLVHGLILSYAPVT